MYKRVKMEIVENLLRNGGKVEKNARNQLIVYERYTRDNHPEWFIGCKDDYTEYFHSIGYIQNCCYEKVLKKINEGVKKHD